MKKFIPPLITLLSLFSFSSSFALTVGPDAFGYMCKASTDAGGPTYHWLEIAPAASGSGISIKDSLSGLDDGYYYGVPIGFPFNFYGVEYDTLAIGTNGVLYFMDDYLGLGNTCPLTGSTSYDPQIFIASFWDDLKVDSLGADIAYKQFTDSIIIEYYHVSRLTNNDTNTWQIVLRRNGDILVHYQNPIGIDTFGSASLGIVGDTAGELQYGVCNDPNNLAPGTALEYKFPCIKVYLGPDIVGACGSETLDADQMITGQTYLWSTGATTQAISINSSGNYSVTVTSNGNGCIGTSRDSVNAIFLPKPTPVEYTTCKNAAVPSGEGLFAPNDCPRLNAITGTISLSDDTMVRNDDPDTFYTSSGTSVHYDTYTFTVSATGSYTFTTCGANNWDVFTSFYKHSFSAASPAVNIIKSADDGGTSCSRGSTTAITLKPDTTYILVISSYRRDSTGDYSVTFSGPGIVSLSTPGELNWFTGPSGGSVLSTDSVYNPVGASGSGLSNTNTAGVHTFYVACATTQACRTAVDFTIENCAGIQRSDIIDGLVSLFPNPATDVVNVKTEGISGKVTIQVLDMIGQVVKEISTTGTGGTNITNINTAGLPASTYVVKVTTANNNRATFPLVIQK